MLDHPYLFDDPFYEGLSTPRADIPGIGAIALGGHIYALEPKLYRRSIVPPFRDPVDQGVEPSEASLTTKGSWARTCRRWDHGAGQLRWDDPSGPSDRFRFRESDGVDVWTERGTIRLMHSTRKIRSTAASNSLVILAGNQIYVAEGTAVFFTADPTVASPTWTNANIQTVGTPGTVTDLTTDGSRVWAACGSNGVHRVAVAAVGGVRLSATDTDRVWYANGRLLGAKNNNLYELDSSGMPTPIKNHDNSSFVWRVAAGSNNGIYVSGYVNDVNELYYVGVTDVGALAAPIYAAPLPDGEYVADMKFYAGVILIRTNRGLRVGIIQGDNGISFGSFIPVPSNVVTVQGSQIEPQGEDVWFDWPSKGLGRARLSAFTESLVPAYATDLAAAETGAISGVVSFSNATDANGLAIYQRYFMVRGGGLYAEYANLVSTGTLRSGWIDYGTPLPKIVHSIDYRHAPLAGGVAFSLADDTAPDDLTRVAANSSPDSVGPPSPVPIGIDKTENIEMVVGLSRSATDPTEGPVLRRWTLRAFPVTVPTVEWWLPIILRERVDTANMTTMNLDVEAELEALHLLAATGNPTALQIGHESARVRVDEITALADDTRRWTDTFRFLQGIYMVHCVEVG